MNVQFADAASSRSGYDKAEARIITVGGTVTRCGESNGVLSERPAFLDRASQHLLAYPTALQILANANFVKGDMPSRR